MHLGAFFIHAFFEKKEQQNLGEETAERLFFTWKFGRKMYYIKRMEIV